MHACFNVHDSRMYVFVVKLHELCKMSREIECDHSLLKGRHTHAVNDWVAAVLQVDDNHPVSLRTRLFDRHTALVTHSELELSKVIESRVSFPCWDVNRSSLTILRMRIWQRHASPSPACDGPNREVSVTTREPPIKHSGRWSKLIWNAWAV
jgi:hypothetical protein